MSNRSSWAFYGVILESLFRLESDPINKNIKTRKKNDAGGKFKN